MDDGLFSLNGRVALVTGGSSGIGRAMAEALAGAGASVILTARREGPLRETVRELAAAGCRAAVVAADLADRTAVARVAQEAAEPFGQVDILVNAAAVNRRPPLDAITVEDWDHTMAVNVDAPFLLGRRLGPAMADRGFGRIINIASQQAVRAYGNSGAYGVSKGAIASLTRSQAEAWSRQGVCCNAVAPGVVRTPLTREAFADPAYVAGMTARTMIGRLSGPADFCGIAVFLASRAADYVTGQVIFVDGGFSAH